MGGAGGDKETGGDGGRSIVRTNIDAEHRASLESQLAEKHEEKTNNHFMEMKAHQTWHVG